MVKRTPDSGAENKQLDRAAAVDQFFDRVGKVDSRIVQPFITAVVEYWDNKVGDDNKNKKAVLEKIRSNLEKILSNSKDGTELKRTMADFLSHADINLEELMGFFNSQSKENAVIDESYEAEVKRYAAIDRLVGSPAFAVMENHKQFIEVLVQLAQEKGMTNSRAIENLQKKFIQADERAKKTPTSASGKQEAYQRLVQQFLQLETWVDIDALSVRLTPTPPPAASELSVEAETAAPQLETESNRESAILAFLSRPDIAAMEQWQPFFKVLVEFVELHHMPIDNAPLQILFDKFSRIDKKAIELSKSLTQKQNAYRMVIRDFLVASEWISMEELAAFYTAPVSKQPAMPPPLPADAFDDGNVIIKKEKEIPPPPVAESERKSSPPPPPEDDDSGLVLSSGLAPKEGQDIDQPITEPSAERKGAVATLMEWIPTDNKQAMKQLYKSIVSYLKQPEVKSTYGQEALAVLKTQMLVIDSEFKENKNNESERLSRLKQELVSFLQNYPIDLDTLLGTVLLPPGKAGERALAAPVTEAIEQEPTIVSPVQPDDEVEIIEEITTPEEEATVVNPKNVAPPPPPHDTPPTGEIVATAATKRERAADLRAAAVQNFMEQPHIVQADSLASLYDNIVAYLKKHNIANHLYGGIPLAEVLEQKSAAVQLNSDYKNFDSKQIAVELKKEISSFLVENPAIDLQEILATLEFLKETVDRAIERKAEAAQSAAIEGDVIEVDEEEKHLTDKFLRGIERLHLLKTDFRNLYGRADEQLQKLLASYGRYVHADEENKDKNVENTTKQLRNFVELRKMRLATLLKQMDEKPQFVRFYNEALQKLIQEMHEKHIELIKNEISNYRWPALQEQWEKIKELYGADLTEMDAKNLPITAKLLKLPQEDKTTLRLYFEHKHGVAERAARAVQAKSLGHELQTKEELGVFVIDDLYEKTEEVKEEFGRLMAQAGYLATFPKLVPARVRQSGSAQTGMDTLNKLGGRVLNRLKDPFKRNR